MKRYVLDASVAAKWFLAAEGETLVDEAMELLRAYTEGEVQFLVPDLFFAEFVNLLWKAERLGRCDPKTADQAVAAVLARNLPCFPTAALLGPARSIARAYGRTVYDSLYLALAVDLQGVLITADQKLVNSLGGRLPAVWLGALNGGIAL